MCLFRPRLIFPGRAELAIDVQTASAAGTSAIAFQSGSSYVWCQNANFVPLPSNEPSTIAIALDPTQLTCFGGSPNFTDVESVMVYLGSAGTYYLDNLRALPLANANSPSVAGALNGAGFVLGAPLPEGGIASLFGSNLAAAPAYASDIPLPNSLDDVSVTVNRIPAPLFYISPLQLNVQIPWNALPSGVVTGTGNIVVSSGNWRVPGVLGPAGGGSSCAGDHAIGHWPSDRHQSGRFSGSSHWLHSRTGHASGHARRCTGSSRQRSRAGNSCHLGWRRPRRRNAEHDNYSNRSDWWPSRNSELFRPVAPIRRAQSNQCPGSQWRHRRQCRTGPDQNRCCYDNR